MASVQHEFAPPAPRGIFPALVLALVAHGLLLLILTAGVQWRRSAPVVAAEAELWAAVPQAAAPTPAPEIEPEPPQPQTAPLPPPAPPVVQAPKASQVPPDIVLEKEKQRQRELEKEKAEREKERLAKLEQEKREREKERERLEKEKQTKLAQEKARADKDKLAKADAAKKEKEEARRLEEMRQQNLKRMAGLAGAGNGDARATGTSAQSAGPSAGYAGRIVARIRPNIVFTDSLVGNPETHVEVHTAPDGTILMARSRIVKSSGARAWDEAVLKALEKTEVLPKDTDGRIPSPMVLIFRPKD